MQLPERDKHGHSIKELKSRMIILFGGRVAEEVIFGKDNISTGAGWTRFRYKPSNKTRKSYGNEIWNE